MRQLATAVDLPTTEAEPSALDRWDATPWADRTLSRVGSVLDRAAMRGMSLVFDAALQADSADLGALRASAEPYLTPQLARDPRRFFRFLDRPMDAELLASVERRALPGGAVVARRFLSGYRP